jgi:biotin-(acetyl-CoA carboxylase) ligase
MSSPKLIAPNLYSVDSCESTQDEARALWIGQGRPQTLIWLVSEQQSHGRGRQGKFWDSKPGDLIVSCVFDHSQLPPKTLSLISLLAGISLYQCFEDHNLTLKWPNDLGRFESDGDFYKCAGVLAEAKQNSITVGWGVNLNPSPRSLAPNAPYRSGVAASPPASELLEKLRTSFEFNVTQLCRNPETFCAFLMHDLTEAMRHFWGQRGYISSSKIPVRAHSLSDSGELIVIDDDGKIRTLRSGEFQLSPLRGQ